MNKYKEFLQNKRVLRNISEFGDIFTTDAQILQLAEELRKKGFRVWNKSKNIKTDSVRSWVRKI